MRTTTVILEFEAAADSSESRIREALISRIKTDVAASAQTFCMLSTGDGKPIRVMAATPHEVVMTNNQTQFILKAMEKFGGGFIQQFVRLWQHADEDNKRKLRIAFDNYFQLYDQYVSKMTNEELYG